jgi:hypothetical protein
MKNLVGFGVGVLLFTGAFAAKADLADAPKKVTLQKVEIFPEAVKIKRMLLVTADENIEIEPVTGSVTSQTPAVMDKLDKTFPSVPHLQAYVLDNFCLAKNVTANKRVFALNNSTTCQVAVPDGVMASAGTVKAYYLTEGATTVANVSVSCN